MIANDCFAVPVTIVRTSWPVHQNLTMNRAVTFTVEFTGREAHDFSIRWTKDGQALEDSDPRVHNSFNAALSRGRTDLNLPLALRSDAGVYHVIISSQVGAEGEPPAFSSQQQVSFQMDVTGKA